MPILPSGLKTFEATDTVRRIAQNENIEATDALFDKTTGHRHSGADGDAPQIGKEGIASGAVTTEKLAGAAVTGEKLARGGIERMHHRASGLSSNIAKYKRVTVTGGALTGNPTTPYTFQSGSAGDSHLWTLPSNGTFPQSITIHLGRDYFSAEGMSFGSWVGNDASTMPRGFYIEASNDNATWTKVYTHASGHYEPFAYLPFSPVTGCKYVRLTITATSVMVNTVVSCLAVYSKFHGNVDLDALEDERSWGLNARMQGLMIIPEGKMTDNGSGTLTLTSTLIVMNPASGTYFRVNAGTFQLPDWGYLYVDIPHSHGAHIAASVGTWIEGARQYDNKNRIVLAQRSGNGSIYFHSAIQSRLTGPAPDADKVDGIDFRVSGGNLEFSNGSGWRGVGIKSVQRGYGSLYAYMSSNEYYHYQTITISPVNMFKTFINVHFSGYNYRYNGISDYIPTTLNARLTSSNSLYVVYHPLFETSYANFSWEVIEYA
ncbi:discoidin domain-containing protein [Paenibacillus arenilitoris]|uniref:F5/8 type C domain-containing protein n=1 Tax=Paenibacillus arenilitoris TaxID=2772299 RepID=A0A927CIK0_9BACL|nr:discoidin domain-containing protein [Paenibacillus arenilitoris]MBD2867732.1 hypothetical protein [Paenibacillus arenilitoris]